MDGIEQLLISNIAAITTAGGFLVYLYKKSLLDKKTFDGFNNTISNHLKTANKVIKNDTEAKLKFVQSLQQLTDCIKYLNSKKK